MPATSPARPPRSRRRLRAQLTAWAFIAPVVVYLVVFYAYPLYRNLDLSFRDYTLRSFIDGTAPFVWFDNYVEVIQSSTFTPALHQHGGVHAGVHRVPVRDRPRARCLLLQAVPARRPPARTLPGAMAASRCSSRHRSGHGCSTASRESSTRASRPSASTQVNWLTSPQWAMVSVLIANIWIGIPFNLVILYSGLQNIPGEVYEAAALDGANGLAAVLAHHLPAAASGLGDHAAARPRLHAQGLRHHLDHDARRPRQLLDHLRDLVVPARLRRRLARAEPGGGGGQPAHRRSRSSSASSTSAPSASGGSMTSSRSAGRERPCSASILTALMLFPLYWMVNVSLTQPTDMRKARRPLPAGPDVRRLRARCSASSCPTSARASSSASARSRSRCWPRRAGRLRAREAAARAAARRSNFVLLVAQMIPGVVMAMGFYSSSTTRASSTPSRG